ncbi:tetratricopeptide repeat protein [Roseibium sp.]|uniref:tetratricopeptide repeat protein n=1 Tax=Roseibium sp. TaxID=1936156 RepID=UPI003B5120A2
MIGKWQKHSTFQAGHLLAAFLLCLVAFTSAARTQTSTDDLFEALKNAPNEKEARLIETEIWEAWIDAAPTPDLREQVESAMRMRGEYNYQGAREVLDKVVAEAPDYPEGWNQRAFILFLQGDYEASLKDIKKVLELEPRHFGALSGQAMIYITQGRAELAQKTLRDAVNVHPYLKERALLIKPKGVDL